MPITTEIKHIEALDPELVQLCPYCDQPIFWDASIIYHKHTNAFGIAHGECVEQEEGIPNDC